MKIANRFLLLALASALCAPLLADNRLYTHTPTSTVATDDKVYLDGPTLGTRALAPNWWATQDLSFNFTGNLTSVVGLRGKALPALAAGLLRYNGTSWVMDSSAYLTANQTITLSSDLSGSGTTGIAATIVANAVTNAKAAQMATLTIKGNATGGTADPQDLSVAAVNAMLGTFANPMTTVGDVILGGASGAATRLAKGGNGTFLGVSGGVVGYYTPGGGGNVSNTGTPTAGQAAEWTSATVIQGVAVTGTGSYVKGTAPTITLSNGSGLPIAGISGLGAGVPAWLASPAFTLLNTALTGDSVAGLAAVNAFTGASTHAGVESWTGASIKVGTPVSGNAIDVTKQMNTKSLTGSVTATFTGSPTTRQWFGYEATADASGPYTVTLPANVYPLGSSAALTSFTVPASSTVIVYFVYTGSGSTYRILGNPPVTTGSGSTYALSTSPVFVTPTLGDAVATTVNGNTFTTGTFTLTGSAAKTLTFSNSLTLAGTDSTVMTFPTTSASIARIDAAQTFVGTQTGTFAIASASTATTQTAGDASTKVSTTAYADTAGKATNLGTFASPNTAAGAITWSSPVYNIYTSASAALRTYTLPAASSYGGKAFILNVVVGTNHVNVQPASGAQLVLAGTLLTANHYAQLATSAAGNYICFISDGTNWTSLGSAGTWTDATSP